MLGLAMWRQLISWGNDFVISSQGGELVRDLCGSPTFTFSKANLTEVFSFSFGLLCSTVFVG